MESKAPSSTTSKPKVNSQPSSKPAKSNAPSKQTVISNPTTIGYMFCPSHLEILQLGRLMKEGKDLDVVRPVEMYSDHPDVLFQNEYPSIKLKNTHLVWTSRLPKGNGFDRAVRSQEEAFWYARGEKPIMDNERTAGNYREMRLYRGRKGKREIATDWKMIEFYDAEGGSLDKHVICTVVCESVETKTLESSIKGLEAVAKAIPDMAHVVKSSETKPKTIKTRANRMAKPKGNKIKDTSVVVPPDPAEFPYAEHTNEVPLPSLNQRIVGEPVKPIPVGEQFQAQIPSLMTKQELLVYLDAKYQFVQAVPSLPVEYSWSLSEKESFLLGVYIFGKNFCVVSRFIRKEMGQVLHYYYADFCKKGDQYRRWSVYYKKMCKVVQKQKKGEVLEKEVPEKKVLKEWRPPGQEFFQGWRLKELVSRLLPHVTEECTRVKELVRNKGKGKQAVQRFVFALRNEVGLEILSKAVAIGKENRDFFELEDKRPQVSTALVGSTPAGSAEVHATRSTRKGTVSTSSKGL